MDWLDYGARMYDPTTARFTTIDPLTEYFPFQSPFVYANNNPIRYIDYLGLSASDTTYIAPDIETVVIVGTRPNNNSNNSGSSSWWATTWLGRWWNRNKPYYDERYVNDPMSQDLNHLDILGNQAGVTPVIPHENKPLNDKVFGRRNKREKTKIEGDNGAIEATINDKFKENLGKSNEPANEPNQQVDDSVFVRYRLGDYRTYTKYVSVNDTSGMNITERFWTKRGKKDE